MKKILHNISVLLLSAALICTPLPVRAANYEIPGSCQVQTEGGAGGEVKTLDYGYSCNTYFSLRDIAMILRDTDKRFSLEIAGNTVALSPGGTYRPNGSENRPWGSTASPNIVLRRNEFKVGGEDAVYYTLIARLPSGGNDCFMMAADIAMILDVDISFLETGVLEIDTREPFSIDPAAMEQAGYFYGVNSALVGNASTGEIYYQYQANEPYPIASTSKLMTVLLVMEAISAGQLAPGDFVTVSEAANALAVSNDGVLPLALGMRLSVKELLLGTLLPSSNECALTLAEAVAGSEEAFVRLMNQRALELGLSEAVFFNSNGLPSYTQDPIPAKRQNRMSAADMFRLASRLLRVYPQITDITSLKSARLEGLNQEVKNTNPLLHNLPGVTGLKTGTTNKAGACLVTSLTASDGGTEQDLVVVVLGTEDSTERGRVSGLLARYGLQAFRANAQGSGVGTQIPGGEAQKPGSEVQAPGAEAQKPNVGMQVPGGGTDEPPVNAEVAVDWIIRTARKR